jgi:hypothetical protein
MWIHRGHTDVSVMAAYAAITLTTSCIYSMYSIVCMYSKMIGYHSDVQEIMVRFPGGARDTALLRGIHLASCSLSIAGSVP